MCSAWARGSSSSRAATTRPSASTTATEVAPEVSMASSTPQAYEAAGPARAAGSDVDARPAPAAAREHHGADVVVPPRDADVEPRLRDAVEQALAPLHDHD